MAMSVACDRDRNPDEEDFSFDGGTRDGGPPRGGRGGDAGPTAGRMSLPAGRGAAGAGAGGTPVTGGVGGFGPAGAGGAQPAGAGAPDPGIDCSVDNGGCGDPEYIQCIATPNGGYCLDINECSTNNGGCDRLTYCNNVYGGPPTCGSCPFGYEADEDEGCVDIDECDTNNGGCGNADHIRCVNFDGSYTCEDVAECQTDNGGCGEAGEAFCIEQYGMAPICRVNECATNNGGCGSPDTSRCIDRPDITSFCVGKVTSVAASEPICLLRGDQAVDCVSPEIEGGVYRLASRYTKISTSQQHFLCGVEASGGVHCEIGHAELQTPPSGTNFTAISTGNYHACALRSDGTAGCWGVDQGGSVSRPHFESGLRAIAAGGSATCVVRTAGTIACFGADEGAGAITAVNADGGTDFIAVYMGPGNVCGLHMGGAAECWGDNTYGQVTGVGQAASTTFTSLSVGEGTICGLRTDGTVRCWGYDEWGQASGPNGAESGVTEVNTGAGRTCLTWSDGTFRCYGLSVETANADPWARPVAD